MSRIYKGLLSSIVSVMMVITTSLIPGLFNLSMVSAAGIYTAETGVYNLEGNSTNDHSNAFYLWEFNNRVYVASTIMMNSISEITVDGLSSTDGGVTIEVLPAGDNLVVNVNQDPLINTPPLGEKVNKNHYWVVASVARGDLPVKFNSILLSILGAGGHEIVGVTYTIVGALDVGHKYLPSTSIEHDDNQSEPSNTFGGLTGYFVINPIEKTGFGYSSVVVLFGEGPQVEVANVNKGTSFNYPFTEGTLSIDSEGKIILDIDIEKALSKKVEIVYSYERLSYTVNLSVSPIGGGTVSGDGTFLFEAPVNINVVSINPGYVFLNWTDDDNGNAIVSSSASYNFNMPARNLNYTANFAEGAHVAINYVANTGGNVSSAIENLAPVSGIAQGSTATASAGYTFTNWTKDSSVVSTDPTFVPQKVDGLNIAATYYANFTEDANITINYVAGTGGGVSRASESLAPATGTAQGSIATPAAGYTFTNWTRNDVEVSTSADFVPQKVEGVNVPATYKANFTQSPNITINYVAGTGGSVSRSSESLAPVTGTAQGSIATASNGYSFVNWTLDGEEVSTNSTFVPEKVDGLNVAATYTANFQENANVTINYIANTGGSVSSASESLAPVTGIAQGSVATAAVGYTFANWIKDGLVVSTSPTYVPTKVDGLNVGATYYANFTENANVTINYVAGLGGNVSRESESLAPATGTSLGSIATALNGYSFVNWTKDGLEVSTSATFVPEKVSGLNVAATYTANFQENANVTINYIANTGGIVSSASESLAPATGIAQGSVATASAGYTFTNWTKDGSIASLDPSFIPAKVDGVNVGATYYANFTENSNITINYIAGIGGNVSRASESLAPATGTSLGSIATASAGYTFTSWTKDGLVVSTSSTYVPPKVDGLHVAATYTANFTENANITINYEAGTGGSVSRESESLAPATGTSLGSIATASAGYTFTSWTKDGLVVSTSTTYVPPKVDGLNVAATYTANFTENENVSISYIANAGGSVNRANESLAPVTGTALGSIAIPNIGYAFVSWTKDGLVVSTSSTYVPPKVDGLNVASTYYANFVAIDYTLSYVTNMDGLAYPDETFNIGDDITAPLPNVPGYNFLGWFWYSSEMVQENDMIMLLAVEVPEPGLVLFPYFDSMPPQDVTVYAQWEAIDYTFTFNPNYGEEDVVEQTFNVGGSVAGTTFTRTGYIFDGWTIDQAGDDEYEGGLSNLPAENIYVYAQWEAIDYTFTFDPNWGEEVNVVQEFNVGGSVEGTVFVREGFVFDGWTLDEDGLLAYEGGLSNLPAEDVYVFAQWTAIDYSFTFDPNWGEEENVVQVFNLGGSVAGTVFVREGYVFDGWTLDEAGLLDYEGGLDNLPAEDVYVYAQWAEVLGEDDDWFILTYVSNIPGLSIPSVSFQEFDSITPVTPTAEGFIFQGWYLDEELTIEFGSFDNMPANDLTVYADWAEVLGDDDDIPDTSDRGWINYGYGLILLGALLLIITSKEEELE